MNKDVKFFGELEIKRINATKGIKFQIELEDTNEEIEGRHIVNIIWKNLNGNKILTEQIFETLVHSYLSGIKSTLDIMKEVK